jgi:hypothetical protein
MANEKYLVVSETTFCDVETNREALNEYFERLKVCLLSIDNIDVAGFDYRHLLYVSRDKSDFIEKIKNFIENKNINFVEVVEYDHPKEGYPWGKNNHIDLIKNPSRSAGYRDKLFEKANINHSGYNGFLRVAIDDDDAWLSGHLGNLLSLGIYLYGLAGEQSLVAGGVLSSYIAKVKEGDSQVELEKVELDRAVCGNKFYFSKSWERIREWSPWSIPDVINTSSIEKFKKNYDISLFRMSGVEPGFVYFRRGLNLSSQSKSWCTTEVIDKKSLPNESSVIQLSQAGIVNKSPKAIVTGAPKYHEFSSYSKGDQSIFYKFPCDCSSGDGNLKLSFYLYRNGKVEKKIGYTERASGFFKISPCEYKSYYEVVCFMRVDRFPPVRIKSQKIIVG